MVGWQQTDSFEWADDGFERADDGFERSRGGPRTSSRTASCAARPAFVEAAANIFIALGHDPAEDQDGAVPTHRRLT
jgi:hypothetical protein